MHLSPRDIEKLMLHNAGFLAQQRLARGLRLNYPEAVALISSQLLELSREGKTVAELQDYGKRMLGRRQVMSGIDDMIESVQVEGTFPDGTKLVTVHDPIKLGNGDLSLALYGSFLPVPDLSKFGDADAEPDPLSKCCDAEAKPADSSECGEADKCGDADATPAPGEVITPKGKITLNKGRETKSLKVTNTGDRPIQVGSHFHFVESNRMLCFDRSATYGMRLNIPAGAAIRFEPGEKRIVDLVEIAGKKIISGGNSVASDGNNVDSGKVTEDNKELAEKRVAERGFCDVKECT